MQALLSAVAVPRVTPVWNMRGVGRKSAAETPMQRARLAAGLRQSDVAEKVGVEPATIQRWETGQRTPNADALIKLAEIYGASVDEMLGLAPAKLRAASLPIPSEEQLEEAIRGFAEAFFPDLGPLDEEATRSCALAWHGYLAGFAANPARFAAPGQTAFAVDLLSDQYARQQRRAS